MGNFGKIGTMAQPSRMYVCPNCDQVGCADYIMDGECPSCHYPLFEPDFIYMPNFQDAYDLAHIRQIKQRAKRLGFDEDDSDSTL